MLSAGVVRAGVLQRRRMLPLDVGVSWGPFVLLRRCHGLQQPMRAPVAATLDGTRDVKHSTCLDVHASASRNEALCNTSLTHSRPRVTRSQDVVLRARYIRGCGWRGASHCPDDACADVYFRTFLSDKQGPQGGAAGGSASKKPGAKVCSAHESCRFCDCHTHMMNVQADSKGHQPKANPTGP